MPSLKRHVFVCVNERSRENPKGCCLHRGGAEVRAEFKKWLVDVGMNRAVRANNSGCLDQCEHGVVVVVYPEQVWYGGVTASDVPEIVREHIVAGRYVERLMLPEQPHLDQTGRKDPSPGASGENDA